MFRYENEYDIKKMGEGLMDHIVFKKPSPYAGMEIQYGRVQFIEEDDNLRVKFEYEVFVHVNKTFSQDKMRDYFGKVLVEIIEQETTYALAMKEERD